MTRQQRLGTAAVVLCAAFFGALGPAIGDASDTKWPRPDIVEHRPAINDVVDDLADQLWLNPPADIDERKRIPVNVHVFHKTDTDTMTYDEALTQVHWLDYAFSGFQNSTNGVDTKIDFVLESVENIKVDGTYVSVATDPWGDNRTLTWSTTKSRMRDNHIGQAEALNVYVGVPRDQATNGSYYTASGASSFPNYAQYDVGLDGVWVNRGAWRSLPDGVSGDALIRQAGHWLGLETQCVADDRDPCQPTTSNNYMSWSNEDVTDRFTAYQARRMRLFWSEYRRP
jgi:hypothetical protein